jgi:hypothetical protein
MKPNRLVTLLTDFGHQDWFAGVMKGVMFARQPDLRIIDISHEVPAGDVRSGAFSLAAAYHYFPPGTVHVAVVDPGVGGPRMAIVVETARYFFIGPDNGLLSFALRQEKIATFSRMSAGRFMAATSSPPWQHISALVFLVSGWAPGCGAVGVWTGLNHGPVAAVIGAKLFTSIVLAMPSATLETS